MILLALVFALGLVIAHHFGVVARPIVVGYMLMSTITFIFFGLDKQAATRGNRRIPEVHLYLLSLLGGWPGGLVAQQLFRHKRRKGSFQPTFWMVIVCNVAILLVLHRL